MCCWHFEERSVRRRTRRFLRRDRGPRVLVSLHPLVRRALRCYAGRCMKLPGFQHALSAIALLLILNVPNGLGAETNDIYVPKELETTLGSRYDSPFFRYAYFEQIYSSNLFTHLPSDTVIFTELAFRAKNIVSAHTLRGTRLRMNVFPGSLQEILDRRSGYVFGATTDVFAGDIRFEPTPDPLDFEIRFVFTTPFQFDRRLGQLVLTMGSEYSSVIQFNSEYGDTNGFALAYDGQNTGTHNILATKFSYIVPPIIESIFAGDKVVEVTFKHFDTLDKVVIEGSPQVRGSYQPIQNATIRSLSPQLGRAIVPNSGGNQFFRIRQKIP
jgi:hypothetical protein